MTGYTRKEKCLECNQLASECKFVKVYALDGKMGWVCYSCRRKAWSKQMIQIKNNEKVDVGYF